LAKHLVAKEPLNRRREASKMKVSVKEKLFEKAQMHKTRTGSLATDISQYTSSYIPTHSTSDVKTLRYGKGFGHRHTSTQKKTESSHRVNSILNDFKQNNNMLESTFVRRPKTAIRNGEGPSF
jgi:hypothetical protein